MASLSDLIMPHLKKGIKEFGKGLNKELKNQHKLIGDWLDIKPQDKLQKAVESAKKPAAQSIMPQNTVNTSNPDTIKLDYSGANYTGLIDRAIQQAKMAGDNEGAAVLAGSSAYNPAAKSIDRNTLEQSTGNRLEQSVTAKPATAPGIFAGLKEGVFGMPQSNVGQFPGQEGRSTAYYGGKMLGDIVRTKIGLNTAGEEGKTAMVTPGTPQYQARAAAELGSYKAKHYKDVSPEEFNTMALELEKALPYATDRQSKDELFRLMVAKYPKASKELRSIIGLSMSSSEDEKLDALIQNLEEMEANK
jgi:hypothetical protein